MARYFFYGTLMDRAVRAAVIGRRTPAAKEHAAVLAGFRRVYARDATYPVIIPDDGALVDGLLVAAISPGEAVALHRFEGPRYRCEEVEVRLPQSTAVRARCFLPISREIATDRPWSFDEWRRRHRAGYLARMRPGSEAPAG
jgi:gamma-glutamylcyclotransferase (GGCT)/AIG2-like uncharacterized protein YtfP